MQALLEGYSVLIVDGRSLSAADISNRLSSLGAKVHVVSNPKCAQAVVRCMRLDVALIGHHYLDCPKELKCTLDERGVPYITTATTSKSRSTRHYDKLFSLALQPTA
jgi:PleD family two-component response regulator